MKHLLFSKLRGVSYTQPVIKTLSEGEELYLVRDPNNKFDSNCIEAHHCIWGKIGVISKELAAQYASQLDNGQRFKCFITQITGTDRPNGNLGVNIQIFST